MKKTAVKVKLLKGKDSAAGLPVRATRGSAGFDLLASNDEPIIINPGKRALVPTGLVIELAEGFEAQIRPRSGLAWKNGITLLNTPGTIDSDYRGEVKVIVINLGDDPFTVNKGDRIAQMVIAKYLECNLEEAGKLSSTRRGSGGFGHSGINTAAPKKAGTKPRR
jgi:dUTP pyrophosphatase